MAPMQQRASGSFLALVSFGYLVLAIIAHWPTPGLIIGMVAGVCVGIGGCIAFQASHRRTTAQDRDRPLGWRGWVAFLGGLLLLQLLWMIARALDVAYDVGVFVVAVFGVGGTIFFLWLGWWFTPTGEQPSDEDGPYAWQRPPAVDAEADVQRWRQRQAELREATRRWRARRRDEE